MPEDEHARSADATDDVVSRAERRFAEADGGDAACWLRYVCTECGALVEGSTATPCWRCGTVHDPSA